MESWRDRLGGFVPRALVATHDLAMVWLCWQVLHRLRYAMLPHTPEFPLWSNEIAVVLLAQGAVFWWMGLYRGLWRFVASRSPCSPCFCPFFRAQAAPFCDCLPRPVPAFFDAHPSGHAHSKASLAASWPTARLSCLSIPSWRRLLPRLPFCPAAPDL